MNRNDTLETALVILAEGRRASRFGPADIRAAFAAAAALEKIERALSNISVRQCDHGSFGYPGAHFRCEADADRAARRDESRAARLQAKAAALVAEFGPVRLTFGGDPRGAAIKIQTPRSGRHNTWGGASTGWAV